jgi:transglutaminase-like putative cysteine protease
VACRVHPPYTLAMPVVTIRHTTVYRYAAPVTFGDHRLMFRPRDSHDLRLLETGLQINPPANVRWLHDVFGNSIAVASFLEPARELQLISTIRLEHFPGIALEFPLEPYARHHPFSYSAEEVPDLGRTMERHYPDPDHRIDEWAHRFIAGPGETDTQALLVSITAAIREQFRYEAREAEGTQTPIETLDRASGTCRDFALFMMEAARTLGFAARFVSGYLYDDGAVGGGATHAWVQIYLPGGGWVEFDPTNALIGGQKLVRVAVTRDPSQAIPVAGTWTGAPSDFLGMTVDVQTMPQGG